MGIIIGDRVRFLNAEGGGIVTRRDGRTIYVEDEDGFEIPVLEKDVVAVTVSQERRQRGSDYVERETKKTNRPTLLPQGASWRERVAAGNVEEDDDKEIMPQAKTKDTPDAPVAERYTFDADAADEAHPRFFLALLRSDGGNTGSLDLYAVNDSNCFATFTLVRIDSRGMANTICAETVEPNTKVLIDTLNPMQADGQTWRVQLLLYKKTRSFTPQPAFDVEIKPKGTRMLKEGSFGTSDYFDEKALLMPIIKDEFDKKMEQLTNADMTAANDGRQQQRLKNNAASKAALAKGLLEIDLHIEELLDDTWGLENKDMLEVQMNHVRAAMKDNEQHKGLRIVFIHGVGAGVLKAEIRKFLERHYPKCAYQDASFREYGFGATMVTI